MQHSSPRAGEVSQWIRALAVFPDDLCSVPSTDVAVLEILYFLLATKGTRHT